MSYVGVELPGPNRDSLRANIWTISMVDGTGRRLTDWSGPDDGPEFSADGQWIYFNSERDAAVPGHAQLYRMRADGSAVTQLTQDERVNWFPHVSPDGEWICYLSYPPGTEGHPANLPVQLKVARADGTDPKTVASISGGQGTINVNS